MDEWEATISLVEAATRMGISRTQAYQKYRSGKIKGIQIANQEGPSKAVIRIYPDSLPNWCESSGDVLPRLHVAGIEFPASERSVLERRRERLTQRAG